MKITKRTTSDETDQVTSTYKNGRNTRHKSKVGDKGMIMCCSVVKCMRQGVVVCLGGCVRAVVEHVCNELPRIFRPDHPVTLEALFPKHQGHHVFFVQCSCMLERRLHKPSSSPSSVSSDADICVSESKYSVLDRSRFCEAIELLSRAR